MIGLPVDQALGGVVRVIHADGSGDGQVSEPGTVYGAGLDWSPDGNWLVARTNGEHLHLIQVATGLTLPLGFTQGARTPSWRQ